MKIFLRKECLGGLILWTCAHGLPLVQAAPVDYKEAEPQFNIFTRASGDWNNAKAWSQGHVPTAGEQAVVEGSVIVKEKTVVPGSLLVGGRPNASLTIAAGGELEVAQRIRIGRGIAQSNGILSLEGGVLRVGGDGSGQALRVGDSGTLSSCGRAYLRSGTFEGALLIGSPLPNTGAGTLSVVGGAVSAGGKRPNESMWLQCTGVVEFVLDADGVSGLDYKNAALGMAQGAKITIVGDRYKGPSQTIILISAKRVTDAGVRLECAGFAKEYAASAEFNRRGLVLTIRRK